YVTFRAMHYRSRDSLGFVDKVFVIRDPRDDLLGIAVYAMPPIELSARNHATDGRFVRNPHRLNREMRILRRLVIHPDIRGCGFGHWLLRHTMPQIGTRFVECMAAMGAVHPVFSRAGMSCVARLAQPRGRMALLQRMRRLGCDAYSRRFAESINRLPRV